MVKKIDKGIIIILDVGKNVAEADGTDKESFFEKAKRCAARIIESKILSKGKDYLGVILLGSKKTMNNMAEQCEGGFRRIETLFPLDLPTWKIIRDFPQSPTNKTGDWVEALAVAADHVQNEVSGVNIVKVKIILITNFHSSKCSEDNIKMVLDGLKEYKYEVDVFGPDINDEHNKNSDLQLAREFVAQTGGQTATFHEIMQYLQFHKKRIVRPAPWNVDLSIGSYIKIPVTAYIRLNEYKVVDRWQHGVDDPVTSKSSTSEAVVKTKAFYNAEDQSKVDESDVTKVYKIGHQNIPASESDNAIKYKSGDKSLKLYGFTQASNIHWQHLAGNSLYYVFGRKGDKKAQNTITSLVEILHEKKLVGVARRVYNNNNAPQMFVLMPIIDTENYVCLSMICLCYKEAIKHMMFPPINLKKYPCSQDQVNAMKDLIKAMDLTNAYDETFDGAEAFPTGEVVSPSAQYMLDCLAYRAMNPGKPLPPPREDIMDIFKIPPLIMKRSHEPLEKIKTSFLLQKVEERPKRRRRKLLGINNVDMSLVTAKDENEDTSGLKINLPSTSVSSNKFVIGTINPVKDFSTLIEEGKTLAELTPEMTEVIESLLYFNLDGTYSKALAAMALLRNECVKTDPSHYNNWLQKFKLDLRNRNRNDLQTLISEKGVDFIIKSENNQSTYETAQSHEESQLYEVDTVPESTEMFIDEEIDAMFDEM